MKILKIFGTLIKPIQSTKSLEARNCNNEEEKVFSEDFKIKPQSPEKQQYFSSLNLSLIPDNKKNSKTVKALFSDKISHKDIKQLV